MNLSDPVFIEADPRRYPPRQSSYDQVTASYFRVNHDCTTRGIPLFHIYSSVYRFLYVFRRLIGDYWLQSYILWYMYVSTTVFIRQVNYVGYMFRLLNSHLQVCSLRVKLQDAVYTLGSQCVYISEILKLKFHCCKHTGIPVCAQHPVT